MKTQTSKVLAVIPARYASSRFPGKPLVSLKGKPLIAHVYDNLRDCSAIDTLVVATEDSRIVEACRQIGAHVMLTSPDHQTGTDRVAEVAGHYPDHDVVLNIQGDQPQVDASLIEALCRPFWEDSSIQMTTLKRPLHKQEEVLNPNTVKVVTTLDNVALYFSRSPIPFPREQSQVPYYMHIGLYGFRRNFLMEFKLKQTTPLERAESLEQLRALENGAKIYVNAVSKVLIEINAPEDAALFEKS